MAVAAPLSPAGSRLDLRPDARAVRELWASWGWLLPSDVTPVLFTVMGDVFFRDATGRVHWLNCGTGEFSLVAEGISEFEARLHGEDGRFWLLPDLVDRLVESGQVLDDASCYMFVTLPIFEECRFSVGNFRIVPTWEQYIYVGDVHRQIASLPDGATVRLTVVND